jgi:hypothetical protein
MTTISFARHHFPPDIIRHAVWLYLRFTLSFRDVEDLLAERGLDVSYDACRPIPVRNRRADEVGRARGGLVEALSHQPGSVRRGVWKARSPQAVVAPRHVRNASPLRTRSVRRGCEMTLDVERVVIGGMNGQESAGLDRIEGRALPKPPLIKREFGMSPDRRAALRKSASTDSGSGI